MATTTDQRILERLQRLEDLEDIRTAWRDYCIQIDSGNMPGLANVFTEDAILEMDGLGPGLDRTYTGRESVINDFYRNAGTGTGSRGDLVTTGHLCTNMQIDLQGDEATALAYFFEIVINNLVLIGTYQHRFRRESDRWRVSFLRISVRYRARLEGKDFAGQSLVGILQKPV